MAMIFAVAGTQLPFPRLMDALDAIARRRGLEVVAQTADPDRRYPALDARAWMSPEEFERTLAGARVVVAHCGIGTMIDAARHRRPLVMMPRRAALGEHRNDHQLATARRLRELPGCVIVEQEEALEEALLRPEPAGVSALAGHRRQDLVAAVAGALAGLPRRRS